jgi:hypothetical protein
MLLRTAIRSLRAIPPASARRTIRPALIVPVFPSVASQRFYASGGSVPAAEVEKRIIEILKGFDKVTSPDKVAPNGRWAEVDFRGIPFYE